MATYGSKLSMATLFAIFLFSLFSIHHKVECYKPDQDNNDTIIEDDKQALFRFYSAVDKYHVNWNMSTDVCTWQGISCDNTTNKSFVTSIRIPSKGLLGQIPNNTIGTLKYLSALSLRLNGLSGPIPPDFSNLENLIEFRLDYNNFTGQLPPINMTKMDVSRFNVSNNRLSGAIPSSFSKCDNSSFAENLKLCGPPLDNPCPNNGTELAPVSSPGIPPVPSPTGIPPGARVGIAVDGRALVIGIAVGSLVLILLSCFRKDIHLLPHAEIPELDKLNQGGPSSERKKFEDGIIYSFGWEDLLWSSAANLGKGRIGSTFKALMIREGAVVVVKSLKDVVVTKMEFKSQMDNLGKMKNQNLVPLRAYHWSEHAKLLVYDYMPAGSVYDLLHGSRGSSLTPLDWSERMQIAISAGRGLAYLHSTENNLVHGNFKSSNILLRQETKEVVLSDYGLNKLSARSHFPKVTFESDVYSFGVFLLELLTCELPNQALLDEKGIDLPRWAESYAPKEWKTKVFDKKLDLDVEEVMVQLLQIAKIAMKCTSVVRDQRPPMLEVVSMMEHIYMKSNTIVRPTWE